MRRFFKILLRTLLLLLVLAGAAIALFLQHPQFGKSSSGERLERIRQSPNFENGQFKNQVLKPTLSEGVSPLGIYLDLLFSRKPPNTRPPAAIPTQKTNLHALPPNTDTLIWLGHSSYLARIAGKTLLVDPVLSDYAAPLSFVNRAFSGTPLYHPDDLPAIDYLFITHDHWDHLDYPTLLALKNRVGKIICSLGVGAHLEHWGFDPARIIETDWNEHNELAAGFTVHTLPTHHFSGRDFRRNRTLWAAYLLETPAGTFYFGGDSAYGPHFAETGARFGGVDFAILENGQYDPRWKYSHMFPEQVLQAAADLKAKTLLPVHSGKFSLSYHAWDAPLKTITQLNQHNPHGPQRLITPMIGQPVHLQDTTQTFSRWWESIQAKTR